MGFIWDIVKGLTKTAVNIQTVGAFDVAAFDDDEPKSSTESRHSDARSESTSAQTIGNPEMITLAARMNTVNLLSDQRGRSYANVGAPGPVVRELSQWLTKAMRANGDPVLFPRSMIVGFVKTQLSDQQLEEIPCEGYMGYAGVAANVEDSLHIIVLNSLRLPVMYFAFSDHPNPAAWHCLMDLPDVQLCSEPAPPWSARALDKRNVALAPGAIGWLFDLEIAFANLFMIMKGAKR
jgi:hypothetical protein